MPLTQYEDEFSCSTTEDEVGVLKSQKDNKKKEVRGLWFFSYCSFYNYKLAWLKCVVSNSLSISEVCRQTKSWSILCLKFGCQVQTGGKWWVSDFGGNLKFAHTSQKRKINILISDVKEDFRTYTAKYSFETSD